MALSNQVLKTSIAGDFTTSLGNMFPRKVFFLMPNQNVTSYNFWPLSCGIVWHYWEEFGPIIHGNYKIVTDCFYISCSALLSVWINPGPSTSPHIFSMKVFWLIGLVFLANAVWNLKKHVDGSLRSEGCSTGIAVGRRGREFALLPSVLCFSWKSFVFMGISLIYKLNIGHHIPNKRLQSYTSLGKCKILGLYTWSRNKVSQRMNKIIDL